MSLYNQESAMAIRAKFGPIQEQINDRIGRKDKALLYFAAPWFSEKANEFYNNVMDVCNLLEQTGEIEYDIFFPRNIQTTPMQAFTTDIAHLNNCQAVLAWVDEKDMGTSFEIGYAIAKGIPVYLLGYSDDTFDSKEHKTNLMLAAASWGYMTVDELVKFLTKSEELKIKKVNTETWEGLQ